MNINPQKEHYQNIHDDYEAHYYDTTSMAYRHQFIYSTLFKGLNLNGLSVADIACGSGHNSIALKKFFPEVKTVGFDISKRACEAYLQNTNSPAHLTDLTSKLSVKTKFDAAMIIGGIHHCVSDLNMTLTNIAQLLKPGGILLMMEPNDEYFASSLRNYWYGKDKWFEEETESALSHSTIFRMASDNFFIKDVKYFGGPAYFLILNSLIVRVPIKLKPALAMLLFPIERLVSAMPGRYLFPAFLARWERK